MNGQEDGVRDVVVVGGGAAGLSAGLMLARARRRVTVVDAGTPRNGPADGAHALLGLDGVSPAELLARGRAEVTGYGGEIIAAEVSDVSAAPEGFAVKMTNGDGLHARRLLIATGLADERTAVPGVWVAGNATDLSAQVSAASEDGARAAAQINADLVYEDTDRAVARLAKAGATR